MISKQLNPLLNYNWIRTLVMIIYPNIINYNSQILSLNLNYIILTIKVNYVIINIIIYYDKNYI